MSYDSLVKARADLLAYWPANDTAGSSTIADQRPGAGVAAINLNVLNVSAGTTKTDGPEIVEGLGPSFQGDGVGIHAHLAGNNALMTPLKITTGSFTIAGWYQGPATASGGDALFGRNNKFYIRLSTLGPQGHAGGTSYAAPRGVTADEPAFHALTYDADDKAISLYVNSVLVFRTYRSADLTTSNDSMELLSVGGADYSPGAVAGVFVASSALSKGELRELYLVGTTVEPVLTSEDNLWDHIGDANLAIEGGPDIGRCAHCAGLIRAADARVDDNGPQHDTCHTVFQAAHPRVAVTAASGIDEMVRHIEKVSVDTAMFWTERAQAAQTMRWNGTRFVHGTAESSNTFRRSSINTIPWLLTLHRMHSTRRGHWTTQLAMKLMDDAVNWQDPLGYFTGSGTGTETQFILPDLAGAIVLLEDVATPTQLNRWREMVRDALVVMRDGSGSYGVQTTFWSNGNIQLMETLGYYLGWRALGEQWIHDMYEDKFAFILDPPLTADGTSNPDVGTKILKAGNWVDAKSYMDAAGPTDDWAGEQVHLSEKGATTGIDWDYLQVQNAVATRLYGWTGDIRWLRILNGITNLLLTRVNTTGSTVNGVASWFLDARNGTRKNLTTEFRAPGVPLLIWGGHRPDLDQAMPQKMWGTALNTLWTSTSVRGPSVGEVYYRLLSEVLGEWLRASPLWPGYPS